MKSHALTIPTKSGLNLNARLEVPATGTPLQYAVFAHCFTCTSNLSIVRNIAMQCTSRRIAVLRFDFTGLGRSEGEFADTNFSNNVSDIIDVCEFLAKNYQAPELLIGHSLGGTAVLMAAFHLPEVKAVATIGSPSEPEHVKKLLRYQPEKLVASDSFEANIGGRPFTIREQFIADLEEHNLLGMIGDLRKALLVAHSPQDRIVDIGNASKLYHNAHHPKSFVSLDGADHLLTKKEDAVYVAEVIASWASRYIDLAPKPEEKISTEGEQVVVHLDLADDFTTQIFTERHTMIADEPATVGGQDLGPSPYDYLNAAIGTCTAMTVKLYAERKKWDLQEVFVYLSHAKVHTDEINVETEQMGRIDLIRKKLRFVGDLDEKQKEKLKEIASKCPVHRTVSAGVTFDTEIID